MSARLPALLVAWLFLGEAHAYETRIQVATEGGDFRSVQAAINAAKSFPDRRITIYIGPGVFEEQVVVWEWNTRLTLAGSGRGKTVLRWSAHFDSVNLGRNSTFHTSTLRVDAGDFQARDITIENRAGPVGQAIALSVNADRVLFERVNVKGYQDTLYLTGENNRVLFRDCMIEGTVDFIFGGALAVFDRCRLHSVGKGYVTAASTFEGQAAGFVFRDCRLTANDGVSGVYLGRPWRDHAQTVFLDCEMGAHIAPEGWHDWGRPESHERVIFAEFESRGAGASAGTRTPWSRQLTAQEAEAYELRRLLQRSGEANWFGASSALLRGNE